MHNSNLNSLQISHPWPPIGWTNMIMIRLTLPVFSNWMPGSDQRSGPGRGVLCTVCSHTTKRVTHWDTWGVNVRDFISSSSSSSSITHWLQLRCVWWSQNNLVVKVMSFWMRSWNCLILVCFSRKKRIIVKKKNCQKKFCQY